MENLTTLQDLICRFSLVFEGADRTVCFYNHRDGSKTTAISLDGFTATTVTATISADQNTVMKMTYLGDKAA